MTPSHASGDAAAAETDGRAVREASRAEVKVDEAGRGGARSDHMAEEVGHRDEQVGAEVYSEHADLRAGGEGEARVRVVELLGRAGLAGYRLVHAHRRGVLAEWSRRRSWRVLGELALMLLPLAPYQLSTLFPEPAGPSIAHGREVFALEQRWHLAVEPGLFQATVAHPTLLGAAHAYYQAGHFVGVVMAALLLGYAAPARWALIRTAFVLTTLIALVVFRLHPTAPPNLLPGTIFETVPADNPPDPFAAMPSEHAAWTLWALIAVLVAARALWRRRDADGRPATGARRVATVAVLVAVAHLVVLVMVILATGHHFVLDAVAGALNLGVGFALAALAHHLLHRRRAAGHAAGGARASRGAGHVPGCSALGTPEAGPGGRA